MLWSDSPHPFTMQRCNRIMSYRRRIERSPPKPRTRSEYLKNLLVGQVPLQPSYGVALWESGVAL